MNINDIKGHIAQVLFNIDDDDKKISSMNMLFKDIYKITNNTYETGKLFNDSIKLIIQLSQEIACSVALKNFNYLRKRIQTIGDLHNYYEYYYNIWNLLNKYSLFKLDNNKYKNMFIISYLISYVYNENKIKLTYSAKSITMLIYDYYDSTLLLNKEYVEDLISINNIKNILIYTKKLTQGNKKILGNLEGFSRRIRDNEKHIIMDRKNENRYDNRFYCLKRFNSSLPSLFKEQHTGGGFFIKWQKCGIAIDPGYDFVWHLLNKSKYNITDINYIFVSHVHDDHCYDIEKIHSILFKNNKYKELMAQKHRIYMFCSENTYNKYKYLCDPIFPHVFPLEKNKKGDDVNKDMYNIIKTSILKTEYEILFMNDKKCSELNEEIDIKIRKSLPFSIRTFNAYHSEAPFFYNEYGTSIGMLIRLHDDNGVPKIKILYSGDTMFKRDLIKEYAEETPDIVILNIGKFEEKWNKYYDKHLGVLGCKQILLELLKYNCIPKLVLLSEFGIEMARQRIQIARFLQKWIKDLSSALPGIPANNIIILPSDNNLVIDLERLQLINEKNQSMEFNHVKCRYKGKEDEKIKIDYYKS